MSQHTAQQPTMVSVSAVVIRADGRREELGELAYWHRNPLRRVLWALKQRLAGRRPGRITSNGRA